MSEVSNFLNIPRQQQDVRAKCFHPTGAFVEFTKEEFQQSIPKRFQKIVQRYPNRIAVKTRDDSLTYDNLNNAANQLARGILSQQGLGQEPIALLLEHGAAAVIAILGVLKTGKTYVPLDPAYPSTRIAYMLQDSQATLIVTNSKNLALGRELAGNASLLNIDELDSGSSVEEPDACISPESFALILYTSGSTGQPKGVVQSHRNVLHDIMNYTNALHLCAEDRLILLTSYSVVDTVRTMFGALLNGASLYPVDVKGQGLIGLAKWLVQSEITVYRSFSTLFRHFISFLDGKEEFPKLRVVYLAGEPVHKRDVELYKRHFSRDCIFVNGIGSTECLTYRWYFIDKDTTIHDNNVPVGYALEDIEVLLLDDDGKQVAINELGEMSVKSRYLSPGYWQKPDLSQTKFVAGPGGDERSYRTGDLGLKLADGCLVHMGRKDFQVKVRGYRIEVAEIEVALLNLFNIKEAVVTLREDRPGDKQLVAYIVPRAKPAPTVTALRRTLAERLPEYMVPSAFVLLSALPLLPNGKIDQRSLPAPGNSRPELEESFVAPRTPAEVLLAEIWAEVLKLEGVGIHDNFFDLGGHSLLATQVMSRLRAALR
ncbi:MAG TPA: non-ribosomal peptide synthetase, partial [Candidatus Binatia bacterium]